MEKLILYFCLQQNATKICVRLIFLFGTMMINRGRCDTKIIEPVDNDLSAPATFQFINNSKFGSTYVPASK